MALKERLKQFLNYIQISEGAFEKNVGLSNGFVTKVGHSIREKSMNLIKDKYPQLNTAWLLTGIGEMIINNSVNKAYDTSGTDNHNILNEPETKYLSDNYILKEKITLLEGIIKDKDRIIEMQDKLLKDKNKK